MSVFKNGVEQIDRHERAAGMRRFLKRLRKRRARRSSDELSWKRFRGYSR